MEHIVTLVIALIALCVNAYQGLGKTVLLERGHPGTVPCPLIETQQYRPDDIDAIYWYFPHKQSGSLLISNFRGSIAPQNGIPEGVYDIDKNFSLVIENVSDSDEGMYFFEVKPKRKLAEAGNVTVTVKVTPREPFPSVIGCDHSLEDGECVKRYDSVDANLTCVVNFAKPAVEVRWFRVLKNDHTESVSINQTIQPVVLPTSNSVLSMINNTFTTWASIPLLPTDFNDTRYRCMAYGTALGDKNGSHVTVIVLKAILPNPTGTATTWTNETTLQMHEVPDDSRWLHFPSLAIGATTAMIITVILVCGKRRYRSGKCYFAKTVYRGEENRSSTSLSLLSDTDSMDLGTCQKTLKDFFITKMKTISLNPYDQTAEKDEIFTDLQLHDKDKSIVIESREKLIQLFREDRKHVVIKGEAGCGKTTLALRVGYDWAEGLEYMSRFSLVFVLRMMEMTDCSGLLHAITSQNFPKGKSVSTMSLRSVMKRERESILIILDGFDEIESTVLGKPAPEGDIFVRDVLAVDSLVGSCVLVTTRPNMMNRLCRYSGNCFRTVIEMTGFTTKGMQDYIDHRFVEDTAKGKRLIQAIQQCQGLEVLAKRPIILMQLCNITDIEETVPARVTELYSTTVKVLMARCAKRGTISLNRNDKVWKGNLLEKLGQVAFKGLMDQEGERLVFNRQEFFGPTVILKEGFEAGLLSEKTSSDCRTVTFLHKTFQEYVAAHYLAGQPEKFIEKGLLPGVTIRTIGNMEYLLRFTCGLSRMASLLILQRLCSIKDELESDRRPWVQRLMVMLYHEAQLDDLEIEIGPRLAVKSKEELEAFHYYVKSISKLSDCRPSRSALLPKFHLDELEFGLPTAEDQVMVRSILQHVAVDNLYFCVLLSDSWVKDLEQLNITVSEVLHKPARLIICIKNKACHGVTEIIAAQDDFEKAEDFIAPLVEFCRDKSHVHGFGMRVECDIIKSHESFTAFLSSLAESNAVFFGVVDNILEGYLPGLFPLIPHLQCLELYNCGLTTRDLESLGELLPNAQRLRELYVSRGRFTEQAIEYVVSQVTWCNQMMVLELHDTGLEPDFTCSLVQKYFPWMKPVENVEGKFWLRKQKQQIPQDSPFTLCDGHLPLENVV